MKKFAWLLLTSAAIGALTLGTAIARPPKEPPTVPSITRYYSNAYHDNEIGAKIHTCDHLEYMLWGQQSAYKEVEVMYCPPIPME